jgi:hypothetical protein
LGQAGSRLNQFQQVGAFQDRGSIESSGSGGIGPEDDAVRRDQDESVVQPRRRRKKIRRSQRLISP